MNGLAPNLLRALEFAARMHRDQRRKGADASPYINHPIQVAELLATVGCIDDEHTLMAAVLHDTVEDTVATPDELAALFGEAVRDLVLEVTDDKSLEKAERKRRQVLDAPQLSGKAKAIKIADKICNVRDIGSKPPVGWDRRRRLEYFEWAEQVVAGCRGINAPLEAYFDRCLAKARARTGVEPEIADVGAALAPRT
jgi:guanosine-3',5'-bis(diphosphate) 3'-pyrophosphohydrolase